MVLGEKWMRGAFCALVALLLAAPPLAFAESPVQSSASVWVLAEEGLFELDLETGGWSLRASGGGPSRRLAVYGEAGLVWYWSDSTLQVRDRRLGDELRWTGADLGCESPELLPTETGFLLARCRRSVGLWSPTGDSVWQWSSRSPIRAMKASEEQLEVALEDGLIRLDLVDGSELQSTEDQGVADSTPAETSTASAVDPRDGATWIIEDAAVVRRSSTDQDGDRFPLPTKTEVSWIAVEVRPTPLDHASPPVRSARRIVAPRAASRFVSPRVALLPTESSIEGTAIFDDGRAISGESLTVLSPPVPATDVAADGTFATPAFASPPNGLVSVIARSSTAFGVARGAELIAVSPGATTVGVNPPLAFGCAAGFSTGLFPTGDLNGDVRAMAIFDDGSGPALFVGGTFTTARGTTVNRVARWNGTSWQALGSGLTATSSPSVDALVVFDDGSGPHLYAGGKFTNSGAATVRYVARWSGSAWTQVGGTLGNQVLALAVHDTGSGAALYAGGLFTTSGGTTFNRIAKLTGSAWVAVGSGFNGTVRSLASFDGGSGARLVAGGSFTSSGGVAANRIAQWNGTAWSALGTGLTGGTTIQVNALRVHTDESGTALVAGGRFTTAGGVTANHVARWDGSTWSDLGGGLAAAVNALASFDDGRRSSLFAVGSFTTVSGTAFNRIARWNGFSWLTVDAGLGGAALAAESGTVAGGSALFVGGQFSTANGQTSIRLARYTRPATCADSTPPFLEFASPLSGTVVSGDRPTLQLGASDAGTGLDLSSISFTRDDLPVATTCTFVDPVLTCQPVTALAAGQVDLVARIADLQGNLSAPAAVTFSLSESVPPVIDFVEPVEGSTSLSRRPLLRVTYSDVGSGVDVGSLIVVLDGLATTVECRKAATEAWCVPTADLPEVAIIARATVRDIQGNLSVEAVRIFSVAWPPSRTSFVAQLRLEDGSIASGATLRLEEDRLRWAAAAADGSVTLAEVELIDARPVRLVASYTVPNTNRTSLAFVGPLIPNLGGVTDLGTVVLHVDCDSFFEPVEWLGVEANLEWEPSATTIFDDGTGPALYVAGRFNYSDSGPLGRIARWTAEGWQDVGGGVSFDAQPEIHALVVWDDGSGPALFAGGKFTTAGGRAAGYLAKWDGADWTEVGGGVDGVVSGLAVLDRGAGPVLIAVGDFTRVNVRTSWSGGDQSVAASHVAQWNGVAWSPIGTGILDGGYGSLYRAAVLRQGASTSLYAWKHQSLWRLEGEQWTALPVPGAVGIEFLESFDDGSGPRLVAAGNGIYRFDGASWTQILQGDFFVSLAVLRTASGEQLWVSGDFRYDSIPGGFETRRWLGTQWSNRLGEEGKLTVANFPGSPELLLTVDLDPYTAGTELYRWTGSSWDPWRAAGDTEGAIDSLAQVATPQGDAILFSGPTRAAGVLLGGAIGKWDGATVTPAGSGLAGGGSKVIQVSDGVRKRVYGLAEATGEVAEWNGTGWSRLGEPIGVAITSVAWADLGAGPQLFAAGNGVYRWNGWFWSSLDGPSAVLALAGYGGGLWVAGGYPSVPGVNGFLGSWDGSTWTYVGAGGSGGVNGAVRALKELNGVLYLAGDFSRAGSATAPQYGVTGWNGYSFTDGVLPACGYLQNRFLSTTTPSTPQFDAMHTLEVFDDGRARTLVVGGDFAAECTSQSGNSGRVVGWPNVNLGAGVDGPPVRALASGRRAGGPALLVGGAFGSASGAASAKLAIWHKAPAWGNCSPWGQAPVITVTSPPGLFTRLASVTVEGHLDEPAVLTRDGIEIPLDAALGFRFDTGPLVEGSNRFFLVARDRKDQTAQKELDLVRDTVPPEVRIESPASAARTFSPQPAIDLSFVESGSGLSPETLVVTLRGQPLPASSCVVSELRARCRPPVPLSDGPVEIRATIADRAGNLSAQALVSFVVQATAGQSALLAGSVRFEDGTPAAGARVRALGFGESSQTAADGSYTLSLASVPGDRPLTLVADGERNGSRLTGARAGIIPTPGAAVAVSVITLASACDPAVIADLSGPVGLSGRVLAMAVFDDGTGAALFAGGSSLYVEGGASYHLVKWTGSEWQPVQPAPSAAVRALEVFDDGRGVALYVGGQFTTVGATTARGLARWDGTSWEEVGGGLSRDVYFNMSCLEATATVFSLRAFDDGSGPALYVGGDLARAGGISTDLVARWSGQAWQSMGAAPANCPSGRAVFALAPYASTGIAHLHAAGSFSQLGGTPAWNIARREGGAWVDLDGGVGRLSGTTPISAMVTSMSVYDSGDGAELYAAGLFTRAGRTTDSIASVARWNGERWAGVGEGLATTFTTMAYPTGVQALAIWSSPNGPRLVATGSFRMGGALQLNGAASWDGGTWRPMAGGISDAGEGGMAIASYQGNLVVGGGFRSAGGLGANGIASWDGRDWSVFGTGLDAAVEALAWFDDGTGPALIAGGRFLSAGNVRLNHLGKWTGAGWEPLGDGTDGDVLALETSVESGVPVLYAGGSFTRAGGVDALSVARWSAGQWSPLGEGLAGGYSPTDPRLVHALDAVVEAGVPVLYAGGEFRYSGATTVRNIARWSGTSWSGLGGGLGGAVRALLRTSVGGSSRLLAAGDFTGEFGGPSLSAIGAWDGTSWSPLGAGMTYQGTGGSVSVRGLAEWPTSGGTRVAAVGRFGTAGGVYTLNAALWDGTQWSSLGGGFATSDAETVTTWDDLVGRTLTVGGVSALVKSWSGSAWSTLLSAQIDEGPILALAGQESVEGAVLFVGGDFVKLLGQRTKGLAALRRPVTCGDTAPPLIQFVAPVEGSWSPSSRPPIMLVWDDARSGVDPTSLALTLDGATGQLSCTPQTSGAACTLSVDLADGSHEARATVRDFAGNVSNPALVHFGVDAAAPTLAFVSPGADAVLDNGAFAIEVSYSDLASGVDLGSFELNLIGPGGPTLSCSITETGAVCSPVASLQDGRYSVSASIADTAGNLVGPITRSFVVDTTAPVLDFLDPLEGGVVIGRRTPVALSVVEAGSGVDLPSFALTANGSPVAATCRQFVGYLGCAPGVDLPEGPVTLGATVRDLSQRVSNAAVVNVSVVRDPQPPLISFYLPTTGALFEPASARVELLVGEQGEGIDLPALVFVANGEPVSASCDYCAPWLRCQLGAVSGDPVTLQVTVADLSGSSSSASVRFVRSPETDIVPPRIDVTSPPTGLVTNAASVTIVGSVSEPASLTVDGVPVPLSETLAFAVDRPLVEGVNSFLLLATDSSGNSSQRTVSVSSDRTAPAAVDLGRVVAGLSVSGRAPVDGASGAVPSPSPDLLIESVNSISGITDRAAVSGDGSFSLSSAAEGADRVALWVVDAAGNRSEGRALVIPGQPSAPPDPASVAPPVATDASSTVCSTLSFLYSGETRIQRGGSPTAIDCRRAAWVRGRVVDRSGAPLDLVRVSPVSQPEVGSTLTRADGMFDLVVNGGARVVLRFSRSGFGVAERFADPAWGASVVLEDGVLVPFDGQSTAVDLGQIVGTGLARGSVSSDSEGSRQATLIFPEGLVASAELGEGGVQPLSVLTVRATEYTVGASGWRAMPAALPPMSAYTYAVELSVDEAEAIGARGVRFDRPVPVLLENFLAFPTGTVIPAAWYDRDSHVWVPESDGRVIEILAIEGGVAVLDVSGGGLAATSAEMLALGISDAERGRLATLYSVGQSLWRVPVEHFSPHDFNFPVVLPQGAANPQTKPPKTDEKKDDPCHQSGSIIECENQVLGETLGIVGTPFALHYRSDRVPGRRAAYQVEVPAEGAQGIPTAVRRVEMEFQAAGQKATSSSLPGPGGSRIFEWDGRDGLGRALEGRQPYSARVGYVYGADYGAVPPGCTTCFGLPPTGSVTFAPSREEVTLWQSHTGRVGVWDARAALKIGGWTITPHHYFDAVDGALYRGDGTWSRPEGVQVLTTSAGDGVGASSGDGGPAEAARVNEPRHGAIHPRDGSFYFVDTEACRIRRVGRNGIITTVAGSRCPASRVVGDQLTHDPGDGRLATEVELSWPTALALRSDGTFFIADGGHGLIRRVDPDGRIHSVVAGAHPLAVPPPGESLLHDPGLWHGGYAQDDLEIGPDGALYGISMGGTVAGRAIKRWDPRVGTVTCLAGCGPMSNMCQGDPSGGIGGPASETTNLSFRSLEFTRRGELLVVADPATGSASDHGHSTLLRLGLDGRADRLAGTCTGECGQPSRDCTGSSPDGGLARDSFFGEISAVSEAWDGSLLVTDEGNHVVRRIGPDQRVTTLAGTGTGGYNGEGHPATATQISAPLDAIALPNGDLFVLDAGNHRIRRMVGVLPSDPDPDQVSQVILVPAEDGLSRFVFDPRGVHLRTEDARTGQVLLSFGYNPHGFLQSITDAFGNTMTIERGLDDEVAAVVGPFGQRTVLEIEPTSGYLSAVESPAGERVSMTYHPGGLLATLEDPKHQIHSFTFDAEGRLQRDEDPAGGWKELGRVRADDATTVTTSTAMGRTTSYLTEKLADGTARLTITQSDGTVSVSERRRDGSSQRTSADGTVSMSRKGPDPRFGMMTPVPTLFSVSTPGGLTSSGTSVREATFLDPAGDKEDPANLASMVDTVTVNGRTATSTYDPVTRVMTTVSPEGRQGSSRSDVFGRVVEALSPGVPPVSVVYDLRGRVSDVLQGARATHYTYDTSGQVESVRDPLDRTVSFTYDTAGRVKTQTLPDARVIQFDYDANGNLTSLTPPGRPSHGFVHDPADRTTVVDPPAVGLQEDRTQLAYNLDGQLELVTRPDAQTIDFAYAPASGRLTSVVTPRGAYGFVYQPVSGLLASMSDPDGGSLTFGYDGSLPTSVTWSGPISGSVSYGYNNSFEPVSRVVNGGSPLVFAYDLDGLLTQAGAMTWTRAAATGWVTDTTLGTTAESFTFTGYGELDTATASVSGSAVYSYDTTRDAGGRIVSKVETIGGVASTWEYRYDTAGRLDQVKKDGVVVESYGYDANSNRTSWTDVWGAGSATYDDQDRMLTAGGATYTYSANGDLQQKVAGPETTTYGYDVFGNLRTVTLPTGIAIEYVIDASHRRIGKKVNGTLVKGWLWESALRPAAELDGSGAVVSELVYGTKANVPDYLVKNGTTYRIFTDHLGSVRLVVDASTGAIAQRLDYDAFGRVMQDTNPGFQPFGFAGGLYDEQTGLVRFGARDYDATTGRWTSKDPIGFAGGDTNLYGYVVSDPINSIDSNGESWKSAGLNFVAGLVSGAVGAYVIGVAVTVSGVAASPVIAAAGVVVAVGVVAYGSFTVGQVLYEIATGRDWATGQELPCDGRLDRIAGLAGAAIGGGLTGRGFRLGRESIQGDGWRLAPFGNRTGNPLGEVPHYHRSVPNPLRSGESLPGQGIGRHRPLETKSTDTSFWDRF